MRHSSPNVYVSDRIVDVLDCPKVEAQATRRAAEASVFIIERFIYLKIRSWNLE